MEKIFNYQKTAAGKKFSISTDKVLTVFAWLRMRIPRRPNGVAYGFEILKEDNRADRKATIEKYRKDTPEAWNCCYKEIADELKITERAVYAVIDVLEAIGLIAIRALKREQDALGSWHTGWTIFCNAYKREK